MLDEQALLACAAYVDLNPIRAAMAESLKTSDFTSVQRRIQAIKTQAIPARPTSGRAVSSSPAKSTGLSRPAETSTVDAPASVPDGFLAPVSLEERTGQTGPVPNKTGLRCSDKGFLPLTLPDYLTLLDWTARQAASGKRGRTPQTLTPLFERLSLDPETWCQLVSSFGRLFYNVAGLPGTIESTTSRLTAKRYYIPSAARTLLTKAEPSSPA